MIEPITRRYFLQAGVAAGMRVLDVGSGAGDTALLAAELVGDRGDVIGTDRVAEAVAAAAARATRLGVRNLAFRQGDPSTLAFDRPFDAVVGRYVVMFQSDPATWLRGLARRLRPGGLIVFHEPEWDHARSVPPAPTYDACCRWIAEAFHRSGTPDIGFDARLHRAFLDAGLPAPHMRLETLVGGGTECQDWLRACVDLIHSLLPSIERLGIATAAEVGEETLLDRMRNEVAASGSLLIGRSEIGVWTRLSS